MSRLQNILHCTDSDSIRCKVERTYIFGFAYDWSASFGGFCDERVGVYPVEAHIGGDVKARHLLSLRSLVALLLLWRRRYAWLRPEVFFYSLSGAPLETMSLLRVARALKFKTSWLREDDELCVTWNSTLNDRVSMDHHVKGMIRDRAIRLVVSQAQCTRRSTKHVHALIHTGTKQYM